MHVTYNDLGRATPTIVRDEISLEDDSCLGGWKAICALLGCAKGTAKTLARRGHDPLPVRRAGRGVYVVRSEVFEWLRRQPMYHVDG